MKFRAAAVALAIGILCSTQAGGQGVESLTVSVLPGAIDFTLTSGSASNAGSAPLVALTSWNLLPTRTNVSLYAYFTSSAAALAHSAPGNTVDIPSARIAVSVNGGPQGPFDQTMPFGAAQAGRQIFSEPITAFTASGNRSDVLSLNINLSGYALPADTYVGSLRLRAQTTP